MLVINEKMTSLYIKGESHSTLLINLISYLLIFRVCSKGRSSQKLWLFENLCKMRVVEYYKTLVIPIHSMTNLLPKGESQSHYLITNNINKLMEKILLTRVFVEKFHHRRNALRRSELRRIALRRLQITSENIKNVYHLQRNDPEQLKG